MAQFTFEQQQSKIASIKGAAVKIKCDLAVQKAATRGRHQTVNRAMGAALAGTLHFAEPVIRLLCVKMSAILI